jgi:hypothetical protein
VGFVYVLPKAIRPHPRFCTYFRPDRPADLHTLICFNSPFSTSILDVETVIDRLKYHCKLRSTCPPQDGHPLPFPQPPPGERVCANRLGEPGPQSLIDKHHQQSLRNQLHHPLHVYKSRVSISLAQSARERIGNLNERSTRTQASTLWCAAAVVMSAKSRKTVASSSPPRA